MRCFIQLEDGDKYIRKKITKKQLRALYDLGFMVEDIWDTIELNKIGKEVQQFFRDIWHITDASHHNKLYKLKGKKLVPIKEKNYIFGKPRWRNKNE